MPFSHLFFLLSLALLFGAKAAIVIAARAGDTRLVRILLLLRLGIALLACSYLIRLIDRPSAGLLSFVGLLVCFMGTVLVWIGWIEYHRRSLELRQARAARGHGADGGAVRETPLPVTCRPQSLTPQAECVLRRAQEEARYCRQSCVDTDHLLLGLLREPTCAGAHVLNRLGASPSDLRLALGQAAPPPPHAPAKTEALPLTDRAGQTLLLAGQEAHRFDKSSVGTDHLLLGLVLMGTGAAAAVLFQEGLTVENVRHEVLKNRSPE